MIRLRPYFETETVDATSAGVSAGVSRHMLHRCTTNGDEDVDVINLADGQAGDLHLFLITTVGHANDDLRVTPANLSGGTYVEFAAPAVGQYCWLVFDGSTYFLLDTSGGVLT